MKKNNRIFKENKNNFTNQLGGPCAGATETPISPKKRRSLFGVGSGFAMCFVVFQTILTLLRGVNAQFPIKEMAIFKLASTRDTVTSFKTMAGLGNVMLIAGADKKVGLFQPQGDLMVLLKIFDGPSDLSKKRMQGGLGIILNKEETNSFFILSFLHRIYHLDSQLKTVEERNKLFEAVEAGDGYKINSAFLIQGTNIALGFGGYNSLSVSADNTRTYAFDLTQTLTHGATPVTNVPSPNNNNAYGAYLGTVGSNHHIAFCSSAYGGYIILGHTTGGTSFIDDGQYKTDPFYSVSRTITRHSDISNSLFFVATDGQKIYMGDFQNIPVSREMDLIYSVPGLTSGDFSNGIFAISFFKSLGGIEHLLFSTQLTQKIFAIKKKPNNSWDLAGEISLAAPQFSEKFNESGDSQGFTTQHYVHKIDVSPDFNYIALSGITSDVQYFGRCNFSNEVIVGGNPPAVQPTGCTFCGSQEAFLANKDICESSSQDSKFLNWEVDIDEELSDSSGAVLRIIAKGSAVEDLTNVKPEFLLKALVLKEKSSGKEAVGVEAISANYEGQLTLRYKIPYDKNPDFQGGILIVDFNENTPVITPTGSLSFDAEPIDSKSRTRITLIKQ